MQHSVVLLFIYITFRKNRIQDIKLRICRVFICNIKNNLLLKNYIIKPLEREKYFKRRT